jgi:hypothetical protein
VNSPVSLLFVYNADAGLFNTLADIGHKIFSPATYECALCALTHGYFKERSQWREFIQDLECTCEFLHRDQFRERYRAERVELPAVFLLQDGRPRVSITAAQIAACADLQALQALIRQQCTDARRVV